MARPVPTDLQQSLRADGMNRHAVRHTAAVKGVSSLRRRLSPLLFLLLATLLLSACNANRNAFTEPIPRQPQQSEQGSEQSSGGAAPATSENGILSEPSSGQPATGAPATGAPAAAESTITEPTIGERLGRLDARMQSAPPDSLPILQAEYQALLDQVAGTGNIETGGGRNDDGAGAIVADGEPLVIPSYPRAGQENQIPITAYDSTLELKGLRASELRHASGSGESVAAAVPRESRPRASAASGTPRSTPSRSTASGRSSVAASAQERQTGTSGRNKNRGGSQTGAKSFINGVAASRAGWHAEAADELPRAIASPQNQKRRTLAEYSYGQSLENTGKLSQAADQYLKASRSGAGLGHKSYISYCRVLAKSGQKDRARQLLVQFIGKYPKSDQVVNARQLLQTL